MKRNHPIIIIVLFTIVSIIFPSFSAAQEKLVYPPTAFPVVDTEPAIARPVAVGPLATGGGTLGIRINTAQFSSPMDIYFGILAAHLSPEIFLLRPTGDFQPISQGVVVWKPNVTTVNEHMFGDMPAPDLPAGTYRLFLLASPAGSLETFTLWQTSFTAAVPSAPLADFFTWIGNTPLTVPAARGVLANDPPGSIIAASDTATALGGTVVVSPDGGFTYNPAFNMIGDDTFTYMVTGASATTVTIRMNSRAWYVDNTAAGGGTGEFGHPFSTLLSAQTASQAGDTIFVFSGFSTTGLNDGFTLKPNQKLIGQGVAFNFNGFTIAPAGRHPSVENAHFTSSPNPNAGIELADNTEVAGLAIGPDGMRTIPAIFGNGVNGFNIHDNWIFDTTRISNSFGTGTFTNNGTNADMLKPLIDFETNSSSPAALTVSENFFYNFNWDVIRVIFNHGAAGGHVNVRNNRFISNITPNSRGIDIQAGGGAVVTSEVINNDVPGSGGKAGIRVLATGAGLAPAQHTSVIQGNTVRGISFTVEGEGAIDVEANFDARMWARVTANTVISDTAGSNSFKFLATGPDSIMCLSITGNTADRAMLIGNADQTSIVEVEGPTQAGFEAANPGVAGGFLYTTAGQAVADGITFAPVGFCRPPL